VIIVKEFLLKKLLKVVFEMNLDEILEQIVLDSENYNKFLKLQDEKQVYDFLCEKYNYNENFENFCNIVNEYKSEVEKIFRDKDEKELEKISGGIDFKKCLHSKDLTC